MESWSPVPLTRSLARSTRAPLAVLLAGLGLASCGGAGNTTPGTVTSTSAAAKQAVTHGIGDAYDGDDAFQKGSVHENHDDISVTNFGHKGSAREQQAIAQAVKRYYTVAVADDGATACRMVPPRYAEFMGQSRSNPRGWQSACALAVSKLFARKSQQLKRDLAGLRVVGVRIDGNKGYALLRFKGNPEPRVFAVEREHGVWKMEEWLDGEYP